MTETAHSPRDARGRQEWLCHERKASPSCVLSRKSLGASRVNRNGCTTRCRVETPEHTGVAACSTTARGNAAPRMNPRKTDLRHFERQQDYARPILIFLALLAVFEQPRSHAAH